MRATRDAGLLLGLLLATAAALPAWAETSSMALLERARGNAKGDWNWSDRRQTLGLTIDDGRGNQRQRKVVTFTRRQAGGEKQSLAVFVEPADTRGTAFLQHETPSGDSSQWLYLPDLDRSRRITSSNRRRSFMGTDFSYSDLALVEDLLQWGPDEVAVTVMPGSANRFVLKERAEDPLYARIVLELSPSESWMQKLELFEDEDEDPTKVLLFENVRVEGGVPTAFRLLMSQPDKGTSTAVDVSEVRYDSGLPDGLFSRRRLESAIDHVD